MTLLQMKYVIEIYHCGSMNKAAQNLYVSQSAVSTAIRELESELGISIFIRNNRGIALTDDGRELLNRIMPIVESSTELERYYVERDNAETAKLAICAQRYPFCAKAFVEFIHRLEAPSVRVSFKEIEMADVINEVARQESELGVIFMNDITSSFIRGLLERKHLDFVELITIKPHAFFRKGHPLEKLETITYEDLLKYPYIVFSQSNSDLHFAEEAISAAISDFDRVVYVTDRATIYNVIAHTNCFSTGSGVLPQGYGDDRLTSKPIEGAVSDMILGYIHLKGVPLSPLEEMFVDILRDILATDI